MNRMFMFAFFWLKEYIRSCRFLMISLYQSRIHRPTVTLPSVIAW